VTKVARRRVVNVESMIAGVLERGAEIDRSFSRGLTPAPANGT